jgi:hypothetical protein
VLTFNSLAANFTGSVKRHWDCDEFAPISRRTTQRAAEEFARETFDVDSGRNDRSAQH